MKLPSSVFRERIKQLASKFDEIKPDIGEAAAKAN